MNEQRMTQLLDTLASLTGIAGLTGVIARPRVLTYTVTFRCNARCVMCDSWRIERQDELSLDEIDRILAQLPKLDAVRLTGGEPFVRTDLAEIAALVQRHLDPRMLHVTTNGFLTDRVVEFVEGRDRTRPLHLLVSLDGVGAKHDEVRAVPRAWDRALSTLEALAPRRRELNLRLAVNQTVLDEDGAAHYRPLRAKLAELGIKNHLVVAYAESATYAVARGLDKAPTEAGGYATHGHFSRAALRALLDQAREDLGELPRAERLAKSYYLRGLRQRLLGEGPPTSPRCVALRAHMRLFPNGDVPTCQFNSKIAGSLRQASFAELWSSANAAAQRAWVDRCPGCWAECEVLPSAVYTGALARHALQRPISLMTSPVGRTTAQRAPTRNQSHVKE